MSIENSNIILKINEFLNYTLFKIQSYEISLWSILIFFSIIKISSVISKRTTKLVLNNYFERSNFDIGKRDAIEKIVSYTIYFFGVIIALQTIGLNLSALLAGGAVIAVGIGLGVQTLVSNIFSGLTILLEQPIKKGDFIEMGNVLGVVEEIALRTTTIKTLDNVIIIVPNVKFLNEVVTNWTHNDSKNRIKISIVVAYDSNVELVQSLLLEIAKNDSEVLKDPIPIVELTSFGDNGIHFRLLVWVNDPRRYSPIISRINFAILKTFRENNIVLPFPQRDLNIKII